MSAARVPSPVPLPPPAPPRGGAPAPAGRTAARPLLRALAVAALAASGLVAASGPGGAAAEACGHPGFIGLASHADVGEDGVLRVRWTLTDAPVVPLTALPVAFADGRRVAAAVEPTGDPDAAAAPLPVTLACGEEVAWSVPVPPGAIVHWTLLPWPPVPPALAALDAEGAWRTYAERPPPGRFPWTDVAWVPGAADASPRDAGGLPPFEAGPGEGPAVPPPTRPAGDAEVGTAGTLLDDGVLWHPGPARAGGGYLARGAVGERRRFDLRYQPGTAGAGRAWAVCLLDGRQIAPFDGRAVVAAHLVADRAWVIEGDVVVPGPGWHRLTCLLLGEPGEHPGATAPRPLLSAFVWGDP